MKHEQIYRDAVKYKADKLGVDIDHGFKPGIEEPGETVEYWQFRYNGQLFYAESLRELEGQLHDCLDGGFFRQAEAEADRSFAYRAYGELDHELD